MDKTDFVKCLNIIDEQIQILIAYENAVIKIKKLCAKDDSILALEILNIVNFI